MLHVADAALIASRISSVTVTAASVVIGTKLLARVCFLSPHRQWGGRTVTGACAWAAPASGLRPRARCPPPGDEPPRSFISIEIEEPRLAIPPPTRTGTVASGRQPQVAIFRTGRMSDIVIYEEDDLMRALIEEWLQDAGYRVRSAARMVSYEDTTDLVIVSVYMPKHAGAQLVREIRAAHPGTPVIAVSCQFYAGLSANGTPARQLGVEQAIPKPLAREELLEAVRATIGAPTDAHGPG
jgi:CheY-like chemotaxis protein